MVDERHEASIVEAHNAGYTTASALEIRLKTEGLLLELREKLEGCVISIVQDKEGNPKILKEQVGKPLLNDEGVHGLMFFLTTIINVATVQGNFENEEIYKLFLGGALSDLNFLLAANGPIWGLKAENQTLLFRSCSSFIQMFTSRLIRNKERESYAATFKSNENVTSMKKGLFG